jgi:catechol 2,3-dioxygenase-like lactoylglutathione lyase family enzyme
VRGRRELSAAPRNAPLFFAPFIAVLGRFLEYSIPTADIRVSLDFYTNLGFSQAEVGETWPHPYAVVTDGRIHLGLHRLPEAAPALTFVKSDLLRHLEALEQVGVRFEFRRLGNDVFNELGWLDPSGHLIRMVEARTFSPLKRAATEMSLCGYFAEIALPSSGTPFAKEYWEKLGFVGMDEFEAPLPHVSCTSDSIDIGLYEAAHLPLPTLVFETGDVREAVKRLADAGVSPSPQLPRALRDRSAVLLTAPEGTPILLMPEGEI